jgi:hypothetical protein
MLEQRTQLSWRDLRSEEVEGKQIKEQIDQK